MSLRIFLCGLLLAFCAQAPARMYQWTNPDTGTTQLSGKPPAWYRSDASGPRVLVFENGKLIDDTATALAPTERERLRQGAFVRAEADKKAAREKLLQARHLKASLDQRARTGDEDGEETAQEPPEETGTADIPEASGGTDQRPDAEAMRALIEQWEQLRRENAEQLLKER